MPIGSPDFGANPSTNPTSPSFDTGEDTTRLLMGGGSQARSGRWIFATGFEEGATPYVAAIGTGTGGAAAIVSSPTYQGIGAFKLTGGNAVNDYSYLLKTFLFPSASYGLEVMFSQPALINSELSFTISGGGKGPNRDLQRAGKIVFVMTGGGTSVILYTDVNGSRTAIQDVTNYFQYSNLWHYLKLVFDFETNKIKLIKFDDLIFQPDSTGYESALIYSSVNTEIKLTNKQAGANPVYYIDNLVITADEP